MPIAFTFSDQINTGLLMITSIGVLATLWQIRVNSRSQRAAFLKDLYMQLRTDSDIAHAFYLIEYGGFEYGPDFHDSATEKQIDRLLTLIDLICEMHSQKVISKREISFFDYQFRRVALNAEIQRYLEFLTIFYEHNGQRHRPFRAFQKYTGLDRL